MDYFKHYSTASNSKTINLIVDEFGLEGYAYWFLLLELCAENFDGISAPNFNFHVRIVRQKLRISLAKLELFLTFCAGISEVSFNFRGNLLEIGHPNLLKVKTTRKLTKNNKKELVVYIDKDIDIDKDKEVINKKPKKPKSQDDISFMVADKFNLLCKSELGEIKKINPKRSKQIMKAGKEFEELKDLQGWEDYFKSVLTSNFLTGKSNTSWKASFDWLIKEENITKVLEGNYGNVKSKDDQIKDDFFGYLDSKIAEMEKMHHGN